MLDKKNELNILDEVCDKFGRLISLSSYFSSSSSSSQSLVTHGVSPFTDLQVVRERNIEDLSGGELQRFACAVVCIQRADM